MVRMLLAAVAALLATSAAANELRQSVKDDYAHLGPLYKHFHANPELSLKEEASATRIAEELEAIGFVVTKNIGGHGLVGVLENGEGPTLMIRGDTDALPVKEQTGLPYASTVVAEDHLGQTVPVMHACGHDVHMTTLVGTARQLASMRDDWSGTLIAIAQPAEELGLGAKAMLDDGLFTAFPRPDYNLALHVSSDLPAGKVGHTPGWAMANVDSVDVYVKGVGGHGAHPHATKDPVVIASQIVLALQTLVSREISPLESGVVTVGALNAGAKHNVISDEAHLKLTVRSYTDEVRTHLLEGIKRIARAQALSAGLPEELAPVIEIEDHYTPAVYNNPDLNARLVKVFKRQLGDERVTARAPVMGGEDFGRYGREEPVIPTVLFRIGAVDPETYENARKKGQPLPSLHSPFFAPLPEPTITTGVEAMTAAALDILAKE